MEGKIAMCEKMSRTLIRIWHEYNISTSNEATIIHPE